MGRTTRALVLALAFVAGADEASAGSPQGTPAGRGAWLAFWQGDRAYEVRDYAGAAEAYERAYVLAPHCACTWNAARSWDRADARARAANLYARYLREAPTGAPLRAEAAAALRVLSPRLARVEVRVDRGVLEPLLDGLPLDDAGVYLVPGSHELRGRGATGDIVQTLQLAAGEERAVVLGPAPTAMVPR